MTTSLNSIPDSWSEVDQLISQLRTWGINYLVGLDHSASPPNGQKEQMPPVALIQRLAQCNEYPRVRDASISLFLLHPELADSILIALQASTPEVAEQIAVLTLAAVYLQRLWSFCLMLALGHPPSFPEHRFAFLWQNRHLPPPACNYNEGDLIVAIQQLIQRMQINVEFASPADFMPLPSQWEMHAKYVGRYGLVDVFYFDFYSTALSKIARGNSRDIADVRLPVQQGIINLQELDAAYPEVLAQLGQGRYPRITPQRFFRALQCYAQTSVKSAKE